VAIGALIGIAACGQVPALAQMQNEAAYPGKPLDGSADAVRLFYLTHGETAQETQQLVNLIREMSDIQRISYYGDRRTIALRGTPDQIALAEWLFGRLDKPVDPQTVKPAGYEFPAPNGAMESVRVLYFTQDERSENPQQMINLIRTATEIRRAHDYSPRGAIVLRGTAAQIALAEWLFGELNKPVNPQTNRTAAYQQTAPTGRSEAVRLFFFSRNETDQDLQEIMQMIRTMADIQAVNPYPPKRAIVVRGTPAQIALAEWVVSQLSAKASQGTPQK
jgi:hypothetical protein